jgi:hypothetical protein
LTFFVLFYLFSINEQNILFDQRFEEHNKKVEEKLAQHTQLIDQTYKNSLNTANSSILTDKIKADHFEELKANIDQLQRRENNIAILTSYKEEKIYPKSINTIKCPPPMFKYDKRYMGEYKDFINKIKTDFIDFNLKYLKKCQKELEDNIKEKTQFINTYEPNINDKVNELKEKIQTKYKEQIDTANEKIQSIIKNKNKPKQKHKQQRNPLYKGPQQQPNYRTRPYFPNNRPQNRPQRNYNNNNNNNNNNQQQTNSNNNNNQIRTRRSNNQQQQQYRPQQQQYRQQQQQQGRLNNLRRPRRRQINQNRYGVNKINNYRNFSQQSRLQIQH